MLLGYLEALGYIWRSYCLKSDILVLDLESPTLGSSLKLCGSQVVPPWVMCIANDLSCCISCSSFESGSLCEKYTMQCFNLSGISTPSSTSIRWSLINDRKSGCSLVSKAYNRVWAIMDNRTIRKSCCSRM